MKSDEKTCLDCEHGLIFKFKFEFHLAMCLKTFRTQGATDYMVDYVI